MHVPVKRRDSAGKARRLDFKTAILFQICADGYNRLAQTHAGVAPLADKFAVCGYVQRRQRQVGLVEAAVGAILGGKFRAQFFERLQSSDAQFLWVLPTKHFARLENAH